MQHHNRRQHHPGFHNDEDVPPFHGRGRGPHFGHGPDHGHGHGHGPGFGRGSGFGRGGRGGPGGSGPRARRGALRHVLLDVLNDGPKHGYEIIKALEERTYGQYAPSPGTVYPTLQYLEELGLVRADAITDRRVYHLTDAGRTERDSHTEEIGLFWGNFVRAKASASYQHEVGFLRDELEGLWRTVWNGLRDGQEPNDLETIRRIRQSVEECQNQIRRIITDGPTPPTSGTTGEQEV